VKSIVQPRSLILALACVVAGPASSRVAFAGDTDSVLVPVEWQAFTQPDALPGNHVRTIHVSGDHIWIGTDDGLAGFDGKKWEKWTVADGLPWPAVSTVAEDATTGNVWVGTWGGGLARLSGGRFDIFDQLNSGMAGNLVFTVALFDGAVWSGTNGGLSIYDPRMDRWQLHLERRADQPESAVTALFPRPDDAGELLAGCWCEGFKRFDKPTSTWRPIPAAYNPDSAKSAQSADDQNHPQIAQIRRDTFLPDREFIETSDVPVVFSAADETIWWASPTHVYRRVRGGQWESRAVPSVSHLPPVGVPRYLAARNERQVWVAMEQGLLVLADWDADTWVWYADGGGKGDGQIVVVREQRVVGTYRGESSLPSADVRCAAFQGDVTWVGTSAGLARTVQSVPLRQLLPSASGQELPSTVRAITPEDLAPRVARKPISPPPEPEVVAIFVAGATTRTISLAGEARRPAEWKGHVDLLAAQMAIDDANARGGYRGRRPFAAADVPESYTLTRYGWGLPEDEWVYAARRWGAVAGVTLMAPARRIESAAARSTELPLVNVARTSPTADEAVSGAVFRSPNDDEDPFRLLLQHISGGRSARVAVLIKRPPENPASRGLQPARSTESSGPGIGFKTAPDDAEKPCPWITQARTLGIETVEEQIADSDGDTLDELVNRLVKADIDVVLTCCDWTTSAAILRRMRQAGMDQPFVGGGDILRGEFVENVGATPGIVLAVYEPGRRWGRVNEDAFNARYANRFLRPPVRDGYAAYRATAFLLEAIDLGGLERPRIRRALDTLSRAVAARLEDGRWVFMSATDLVSPSSEPTRPRTP